jgi:hypothetical protein
MLIQASLLKTFMQHRVASQSDLKPPPFWGKGKLTMILSEGWLRKKIVWLVAVANITQA